MSLDFVCVSVKKEHDWDGVSEEAARAGLYVGHEVKEELVLGPEVLQPPDITFMLRSQDSDQQTPKHFTAAFGAPPERSATTGGAVKQEACEARQPPMVRIHSPCYFYELYPKTNYTNGNPATEPKASSDPTSQNLEKYWALYNIRDCSVPLVRIDSVTTKRAIKENIRSTEKTRKPKKFFCDFCSKGFALKAALLVHIRTHTGEKPFSCRVCRKMFSDVSILIRHRRIHTGEKPHVCDVCEKQFSEKYLLRYHKRLHTGDAPYACQLCPKTFNHISNFKRHLRHHEKKPFICEICNLHFSAQSKLETHLLDHLKNKPHACDICEKCFANTGHLNRHLKIHFDAKKYYCKVCQAKFTQPGSLRRHVKRNICGKR